jgi:hypothetical protein
MNSINSDLIQYKKGYEIREYGLYGMFYFQRDDGGNNLVNWIDFVTFQKARLNCSSGGIYRYHFNNMRKLWWRCHSACSSRALN